LDEEEEVLCDALAKDLNKSKTEALLMEVKFVRNDVIMTLDNLEKWMSPEYVKKNLPVMMDNVYIKREPYGVVLIMGAWNYPVQLTIGPMIGALAAGNCVVLKPSEMAEATAELLERIIPKYLDKDCVRVVNGGVAETTALLKERFDYILYTGNSMVGKIIYEAAAKHLTPVTLELGGKCPVYIDASSDLELTARRVMWGRMVNCGQTCIAADYIMCTKEIQDKLIPLFKAALKEYYGEDPQKSKSFGRVINGRHFKRLQGLLSSGTVAIGGQSDEQDKYIAPTVLTNVKPTEPAMRDEIFGPILAMMPVADLEEAIQFINSREKPLALYVFTKEPGVTQKILDRTSSGGVTVNDVTMHAAVNTLPFGGVGNSGIGAYHGKFTFDTFSHRRAVLEKKQSMEFVNKMRYPPYSNDKLKKLSWIMTKQPAKKGIRAWLPLILLGIVLGIALKSFL